MVVVAAGVHLEQTSLQRYLQNVGSGVGLSISDVLKGVGSHLRRDISVNYLASRGSDVKENVLDVSKAKKLLHWSPCHSFDEGLRKTLKFTGML